MRIISILLIACFLGICISPSSSSAQNENVRNSDKAALLKINSEAFKLKRSVTNSTLSYEYYQQYYKDIPISHAQIILVKKNSTGQVLKTYDRSVSFVPYSNFLFKDNTDLFKEKYPSAKCSYENQWYEIDGNLLPYQLVYVEYDSLSLNALYNLETNKTEWIRPNISALNDSTVKVKIFNPDPLSTAHLPYGSPIKDYNDSSYATLMNTTRWLTLKTKYDPIVDSFLAETDYIQLKNIEPNNNITNYHLGDSIEVNRTSSVFEDLMILTHTSKYQEWIADLGVSGLSNFTLYADGWGHFNQDNSTFRSYNPPRQNEIVFGTGGVDDAEDADVIIHEYTHALTYVGCGGIPVSMFSNATKGLQEGLADFAAACYSYKIDPWNWENVYNWDAHNEFWAGRITNSQATLPTTNNNIYNLGEIFNSALFKVARERDIDSTMRLMLEGLFLLDGQTSLYDFAEIILDLDTILYNGALSLDLCSNFNDRGIFTDCDKELSIQSPTTPNYTLYQSQSFSHSTAPLLVELESSTPLLRAVVFNTLGQKIRSLEEKNSRQITIPIIDNSGIYFLNLDNGKNNWTIPIHVF